MNRHHFYRVLGLVTAGVISLASACTSPTAPDGLRDRNTQRCEPAEQAAASSTGTVFCIGSANTP